jgi:hypothetical protein
MSLFWWVVMGFDCERVGLDGFVLYCGSKWLIPMGVEMSLHRGGFVLYCEINNIIGWVL